MFYSKVFDQIFMFRGLLFDSFVKPAYYISRSEYTAFY